MSVIRNVLCSTLRSSVNSFTKTQLRALSSASNILNSGLPDVSIPKVSLSEFLFSKFEKYQQYTAIECGITGRKYTYEEVIKKSKNISRALRKKLGLRDGDVIALLLHNVPEFPLAVLGSINANLIVTTINPVYTADEIHRQLTDSSAKAIITLDDYWQKVSESCKLLKKNLPIITIKTQPGQSLHRGSLDFQELVESSLDLADLQPPSCDNVAFLPYSSGTTGLPKGVQLTHHNLIANVCQNGSPHMPFIEDATETHQEVVPVILPTFHIYGFTVNTLFTMSKGSKLVTLPKFTPEDYVSILRNHKPHTLLIVPPIALFLAAHPMVKKEDLESVRLTFCGAAPLGALDEQRLLEKAAKPIHLLQGYGLTEASPGVTATSIHLKKEVDAYGSIGRPMPNTEIKVVALGDSTGTPLGPNQKGELLVKGPQVMKGYLNNPEATKETFLNGWLKTGDMVYYNEDKILFVADRVKELIKVKGFQVAPAELEEVLRAFPNVEDAAVIGVPHPKQGEAPRAYIVPKKNKNVNVKDLEEYFNKKVAQFKQLKGGIEIVEAVPKNASGKTMRRALILEYERKMNRSQFN